ncbi:MAG: PilC/PilY family type IV pilus protein [Steroidobacteraceae bacterium]
MTVDSSGTKQFYYLSTGNTGTSNNNGIGNVTAFDLDGDHITDYVYAGDLMGNLWRFDLTNKVETSWAVSPGPLFKTPNGQPITSAVTAVIGPTAAGPNTLMILFGTGRRVQFTNATPVALQPATQSLYGVWDWNMSSWNTLSATQFASLSTGASGLSGPNFTLGQTNLQQQVFTLNADTITRDINNPTAICWAGSAACTGTQQFGWYVNMIGSLEQDHLQPAVGAWCLQRELDRARQ